MKNIYIFVGTTAELIKVAPVIKELKVKKKSFKLIATGQNNINFQEFEWYFGKVKPDIIFNYKSKKSSVLFFCIWAIWTFVAAVFKLEKEFSKVNRRKTTLVVHGDTVSSLIGAIVGKLLDVKVAHMESGLRSFNYLEPFPEEISRVIISKLADIHFCPNSWSCDNLRHVKGRKVNTEQNTLYDIYKSATTSRQFKKLGRKVKGKYYVLIMHRQEHVLFDKKNSLEVVKFIIKNSNLKCVLMTHEIARDMLKKMKSIKNKVVKLDRMKYFEFMHVLKNAEFVATDGGSNQEELYYMGKPTLILRKYTERIEGLNKNATISSLKTEKIKKFINNYTQYSKKPLKKDLFPTNIVLEHLYEQ